MKADLDGEIISGVVSALVVSPVVAMVDKAVFSAASGKMQYTQSFKECGLMLLISPMVFFRRTTFKWCFAVYAATFVTANCSDRLARLNGINPVTTSFLTVSPVNMAMNIYKDRYLTRYYAMPGKLRPLSTGSYICYALRNIITIVGAFTCIEPVSEWLRKYIYFSSIAHLISQSTCPIVSQLLSTPFFIYGMDLYNRPKATLWQRLQRMKGTYWETFTWARVARVGPAYSVGGILNMILRYFLTRPVPEPQKDRKDDKDHHLYFALTLDDKLRSGEVVDDEDNDDDDDE